MESRITRYSAAAVVALATAIVLLSPFGTPKIGGVVLADVQKKVNDVETMIIGGTKTFTRPGKPDSLFEFDGIKCKFDLVKFYSKQHGFVEEGYTEDKLFYRITFNFVEGRTLILLPTYKKFLTFTSMNNMAKIMENFATPKGILDLLVEGDYKELGRDKIDGIDAEVFEFEDTESFKELLPKPVFNIQIFKGKLWIGIKEQLPVRIEADLVIGKSFMSAFQNLNLHEVNTLGDYNVELDEKIFDTTPPEGYTEVTLTDILPFIPIEAKAGAAGLGLIPVGIVFWKRRRRKKATATE
ncbi:MAG: hypothetical protein ACYSWW_13065 [Planctomycetota bacterium]|jgi:hypothetical protein